MSRAIAPEVDMNEVMKQDGLSVPEAANVLQVSQPTVYRLVREGGLKHWRKTAGSGIVIYTESILDYIRNVQGREIKLKRQK